MGTISDEDHEKDGEIVSEDGTQKGVPMLSNDSGFRLRKILIPTNRVIPFFSLIISILAIILGLVAFSESIAVSRQVHDLQPKIDQLKATVTSLQKTVLTQPNSVAVLDLSSPGPYSRMDSFNGGTFYVSVQNVRPYLAGYDVTLNIGNPSDATYNGFSLKAKWRSYDIDFTGTKNDSVYAGDKTADFSQSLPPGTWNKVNLIISPASANDFKYLFLSVDTNSISLTTQ